MRKYLLSLSILSIMSLFHSCDDYVKDFITVKMEYRGDPALDGCGWVMVVSESEYYKVHALPENMKNEKKSFRVNYYKSDYTFKGCLNTPIPFIYLGDASEIYD
ncbi:MAG: hypothetical protein N4A45_08050 [Flavobacteriales bacterium]|jgi:hypothetical protein|nr:hypothetical protein [Flavobacteriales bacterium]